MNLSLRNYYLRWTKSFLILFVITIFCLTVARFGFTLYFGDLDLLSAHPKKIMEAFWLGFRFDLMPLAYIFFVPVLILNLGYFLNGKTWIRWIRRLIITILFAGYFILFWIYVCDYAFFSFFQDHINILFYGLLEDDTKALLISIWKNYHVISWLISFSFLTYLFLKFLFFLFSPFDFDLKSEISIWKISLIIFIQIILLAFFGRGNFSRLPLSIEDAHISSVDFINKISINGPISLNRTIKIRKTFGKDDFNYLKKYGLQNPQEAWSEIFPGKSIPTGTYIEALKLRTPQNQSLKNNPPHVILVIMESFGSYWLHKDAKDFNLFGELKNHLNTGYVFKNFLPAENGTIGSVISIATSQVIRPGARFLSESDFMKTPLSSSGHKVYQSHGYETHFVYGGKLGWRDLGKYLKNQQYDYLWGADEIKDAFPELLNLSQEELGNEWGIYDEYLYSFIEERLKNASKPQLFLVLTTTNHPPFEYPVTYKPLELDLSQSFLETLSVREDLAKKRFLGLQYANQKLGEFLTKIKSSDLGERTVISATGDHSFWIAKGVDTDEEFQRFAVPFYIFPPQKFPRKKFDEKKFGSHEDIFPTLFHLTLSEAEYVGLGENLFQDDGVAINSSGLVANKLGAYHHNTFWKWKDDSFNLLIPTQPTEELLRLKKYKEALIGLTDLYLKEENRHKSSVEESDQR